MPENETTQEPTETETPAEPPAEQPAEQPTFKPSVTQELMSRARRKKAEAAAAATAARPPVTPKEPSEPREPRSAVNPLQRMRAASRSAQPTRRAAPAAKTLTPGPTKSRAQIKREKSALRRGLTVEGHSATHMVKNGKRK